MRVGTVSIIGRPNVGKSTLINRILNYKVAITTDTPQTTRDQIKGIFTNENTQIIFVDTPGIHKPKQKLGEFLNEVSYRSMQDVDLPVFLLPVNEKLGPGDKFIIDKLPSKKLAIITKIDLKGDLPARVAELQEAGFEEVISLSVDNPRSVDQAISYMSELLEEGPLLYPEDEITDKSMRFIAKELIRETAIDKTSEEIPHSLGVMIEEFKEPENENESFEIHAVIFVERESQKGILIGKNGNMIKDIGVISRKKISINFGNSTKLFLRVKVKKNWSRNEKDIIKMGY